jgi:hypothetical protein
VSLIGDFFGEIDRRWPPRDRVRLHVIGSTALVLQTSYERGTKDSDVFETIDITPETKAELLEIAGLNSELHRKFNLYLDVVANGIPFLPQVPSWHPAADLADLLNIEIVVLDVIDVVVSKLKRFSPNDIDDIVAMVDRGFVDHDVLVKRFRNAVDMFSVDARAEDLPTIVANLHRVERDMLGVEESPIELPSWI